MYGTKQRVYGINLTVMSSMGSLYLLCNNSIDARDELETTLKQLLNVSSKCLKSGQLTNIKNLVMIKLLDEDFLKNLNSIKHLIPRKKKHCFSYELNVSFSASLSQEWDDFLNAIMLLLDW